MCPIQPTRIALPLLAAACFGLVPAHGREAPPVCQTEQCEWTLSALSRYRVLASEDDGAILPETDQPVEPGDSYEGVPRLIRLLSRIGDLPADFVSEGSDEYAGALVTAVQRFQRRHGLEPDGRITRATLEQLNTPLEVRVRQLELALERWRRPPYDPSQSAIVLNLPEFRLRAFGPGNRLELEMKIVVGQASDHETPALASTLATVVLRPYWNVPFSIQRDELVPEVLKDPSFLSDNHLQVITASGGLVEQAEENRLLTGLRTGQLRLRQTPGPKNVLGAVKFVFPNAYGVYMHGTSAEWLFAKSRRDLSHGCIRVEQSEDLAEWVLRGQPHWSRSRIVEAMHGSAPVTVKVTRPIQVVTMYVTAIAHEDGEVDFFEDIYGQDAELEKRLAKDAP